MSKKMKSTIILVLISLSVVVLACHPSCECIQGSKECYKCKFEEIGSMMNKLKSSCPCPLGYYTKSQDPFLCSKLESSETYNTEIMNLKTVESEQECEEGCIVIVDFNIVTTIYRNSSLSNIIQKPYTFFVGDILYMKITFVQPKINYQFQLKSLFSQNGINQIYDYTTSFDNYWQDNGTIIVIKLTEPNQTLLFQSQMQIIPFSG